MPDKEDFNVSILRAARGDRKTAILNALFGNAGKKTKDENQEQ